MSRELTWVEKAFLRSARLFSNATMGYHVDFDEELVRQHGIAGLLRWGKRIQDAFDEVEKVLGPEKAHVVAAFASFFNGCDYCAWGHLYANNLLFFERTGRLYPLDEQEVHDLMRMGDATVVAELERRLTSEFPDHLRLVKRQHELRDASSSGAATEEDRVLLKSIGLFEWVNECSIVVSAPAPPIDKVARKKDLLASYNKAREPGRAERAKNKQTVATSSAT